MYFDFDKFRNFLGDEFEGVKLSILKENSRPRTTSIGVLGFYLSTTKDFTLEISGGDDFFICLVINGNHEQGAFGISWDSIGELCKKLEIEDVEFLESEVANTLSDAFREYVQRVANS